MSHESPQSHVLHTPDPRFLGEALSEGPDGDLPWWLRAFSGHPPIEIGRHGELPPRRRKDELPLRHGLSATGAPARCRLASSSHLDQLRVDVLDGDDLTVPAPADADDAPECAACAAWAVQEARRERERRLRDAGPLERVRVAAVEVFERLCA